MGWNRSTQRSVAMLAATSGLALSLCALTSVARADGVVISPRAGVLNLRTGDVDTAALANLLDAGEFPASVCVVQMNGPMDPAREAMLQGAGVVLRGYLPTNAFMADVGASTPAQLRALGFVNWVGEYQRAWKLDRLAADPTMGGVVFKSQPRRDLEQAGRVAAKVWLFQGEPVGAEAARIGALAGATVLGVETVGGAPCITVTISGAGAAQLADGAGVQYVEPMPEYDARSNANTRWVVQSNQPNITPLYARGITGAGHIMGIIDGWVSVTHCSFVDLVNPLPDIGEVSPLHRKIAAYNTTPAYDSHGTHVAGTAVGDDGTNGNLRGIAYGARMAFNIWPDVNESSVFGRFDLHRTQGASVHCNSWGTDAINSYDGGCRAIDDISWQYDDNLLIFAVSDSSVVRNPENAKNCLAVSGSCSPSSQENWCIGGQGPTIDGRRKPEVLAPGSTIVSAMGNGGCATGTSSGTSMACPAVSGLAVLTRQYFMDGFYPSGAANAGDGFAPSGALLKAAVTNSAADMMNVPGFPSNREGWGRVLADDTLYFAGDARKLVVLDVRNQSAGALTTGLESTIQVDVVAGQPLKVTLAWHDAPAQVNATFAAINDLDLVMTSPTGVVYRGNNFASGTSAPGGSSDIRNNLEQVLLAAPEAGRWNVSVIATAVNVGQQGYALVASGGVTRYFCPADYNQDGGGDTSDVLDLANDIASGTQSFPPNSPDINQDGGADNTDVIDLVQIISGGCP